MPFRQSFQSHTKISASVVLWIFFPTIQFLDISIVQDYHVLNNLSLIGQNLIHVNRAVSPITSSCPQNVDPVLTISSTSMSNFFHFHISLAPYSKLVVLTHHYPMASVFPNAIDQIGRILMFQGSLNTITITRIFFCWNFAYLGNGAVFIIRNHGL